MLFTRIRLEFWGVIYVQINKTDYLRIPTLIVHNKTVAGVGWISTYLHRFPWCPPLSALNRVVQVIPSAAQAAWFLRRGSADASRDVKAHQKGRRRWLRFVPKPNEGGQSPRLAHPPALAIGGN